MGSRKGWEMHGLTKIAQIWKPKVQKCTTDRRGQIFIARSLFCCTWLYLVSPWVTWAAERGEKCTDWQKLHKYESLKSKNAQQTGEARYSSHAHCFAVHGYIWLAHGYMGSRKGWEMHGLTKIAQIWKPKVQKCTTDRRGQIFIARSLFCCTWLYLVNPWATWASESSEKCTGWQKCTNMKPKVQKCTTDGRGQIFIARSLFCCTWLYLVSPSVTWAAERGEKCTDWQKLHKYERPKVQKCTTDGRGQIFIARSLFCCTWLYLVSPLLHGQQKGVRNARIDKNCTNMKA